MIALQAIALPLGYGRASRAKEYTDLLNGFRLGGGEGISSRSGHTSPPSMLTLYLVRHAQSVANISDRVGGGQLDVPLTTVGEEQARQLGAYLHEQNVRFDSVYVSPAQRAKATARLAGFAEQNIEERITEIDRGTWTGQPYKDHYTSEVLARLKQDPLYSWTFAPPGGESSLQCEQRALPWLRELESGRGAVLAISHKVTIGVLLRYVMKADPRAIFRYPLENTSVSILAFNGEWKVTQIGVKPTYRV